MAYPDLKRAVRELWLSYKPDVVLIEDKASGTQLIQELIEDGVRAVKRFKPEYDKIMRLHAQTATIENGFVYLPEKAHWLAEYLHEMTTFPHGKHDDQVDSTSQFLEWVKQRQPGQGFINYMREMTEERRQSEDGQQDFEGGFVQLITPDICGQTIPSLPIPPSRLVGVHRADVERLLALGYRRLPPKPT